MDQEIFNIQQAHNREYYHELWKKAKEENYKNSSDEEKLIMEIMLEHEEEYFIFFENLDLLKEHEFDPDEEENPIMHITIHQIVENQLRNKEPIEVYQFLLAMNKKKCPRHETIHLISRIFIQIFFKTLKYKVPFDKKKYVFLLKKYKTRKPENIFQLIENDEEEN